MSYRFGTAFVAGILCHTDEFRVFYPIGTDGGYVDLFSDHFPAQSLAVAKKKRFGSGVDV